VEERDRRPPFGLILAVAVLSQGLVITTAPSAAILLAHDVADTEGVAWDHGVDRGPGTPAPTASGDGFLRVTTGIDLHPESGVPGKILVDGVPRDEWGLTWLKMDPGAHVVSFLDVPGLDTPGPTEVTVTAGETSSVVGEYRARGWLRVLTDPPVPGTISVDGIPRNDWGMWMAIRPGTYSVSFGAVAGYRPPEPIPVEVFADRQTTVTGAYARDDAFPGPDPATFGLLRVETALDDGRPGVMTQILLDGAPRDEWGLTWVKVPPGTYTLSVTDVPGLGTPEDQTVSIAAGATTVVRAVFQRLGSLRILTDPPTPATVSVDGVRRNDWGMWMSVPPGTYDVSFESLVDLPAPTPQRVAVAAGELTQVAGSSAQPERSLNWAGYIVASDFDRPEPIVDSARGSWIVPEVPLTEDTRYSSVWVGIGGFFFGDLSLIQIGTEADSSRLETLYAAWFELLPDPAIRITDRMTSCPSETNSHVCVVRPGDLIDASVDLVDPAQNRWTLSLSDLTQGWRFDLTTGYASSRLSAEWIVERPVVCRPQFCYLTNLPLFGTASLGSDATGIAGTNVATIGGFRAPLGAFARREIIMHASVTVVLADPSPVSLSGTSFSVLRIT